MASVARGTRSFAAVRIDAADAAVGPRGRIELALAQILHFTPVTLTAPVRRGRTAFNNFPQHVVERTDELRGIGVTALLELGRFSLMAAPAIGRRDDDRNALAVVIKGRRIAIRRPMARVTVDRPARVRASAPLGDDAGRGLRVALKALLSRAGDLGPLDGRAGLGL